MQAEMRVSPPNPPQELSASQPDNLLALVSATGRSRHGDQTGQHSDQLR